MNPPSGKIDPVLRPSSPTRRSESLLRDERLKHSIETPGRLNVVTGIIAGLALAILYGWLIGHTEIKTIVVLTACIAMAVLVIFVGEYWWAPLFLLAASGISTTALGFKTSGFELGFLAVMTAFTLRMALRAMPVAKPRLELGTAFYALLLYLSLHALFVIVLERYGGGGTIKNQLRAYYTVIAPLALAVLLCRSCFPHTVKPVIFAVIGVVFFTTLIAIPVALFGISIPVPGQMLMIPWLDGAEASHVLRGSSGLVFFGLALWPWARRPELRLILLAAGLLGIAGALVSAGRIAAASVFVGTLLICLLQRKWMVFPVTLIAIIATSFTITFNPRLLDEMPDSVHRALLPLNFSDHQTTMEAGTQLSDRWHEELRTDSFRYWTQTIASTVVGHGYGAWDDSISVTDWTRDFEYAKKMAVRMGRTENAFSSITNIFGAIGLLLYVLFVLALIRRTWRARVASPDRSFARGMCDISLASMSMYLFLFFHAGGPPGWDVMFWLLGILSARTFLAPSDPLRDPKKKTPDDLKHASAGRRRLRLSHAHPAPTRGL